MDKLEKTTCPKCGKQEKVASYCQDCGTLWHGEETRQVPELITIANNKECADAYLHGYNVGNNDCDDKVAFQKGYNKGYSKGSLRGWGSAMIGVILGSVISWLLH